MARGNQKEKAREKALKDASSVKKKNTLTGSEFARTKDDQAAIMRKKQEDADKKKAAAAAGGGKK